MKRPLRNYKWLVDNCIYSEDVKNQARKYIERIYYPNKQRYELVSKETGVPPEVIFTIHMLECGGSFDKHLHNGDPLKDRTVNIPKGRPVIGEPPFTWEESAIDALKYRGYPPKPDVWDINGTCEFLERYNGLGYYRIGKESPYLFGKTNWAMKGKFRSDGVYDPTVETKQIGAVVYLLELRFFRKTLKEE